MRRGSKPEFIGDMPATTLIVGVNLGSDFCAEHEWGIKGIMSAFGIPTELGVYGIKRRQITRVPEELAWAAHGKNAGFVLPGTFFDPNRFKSLITRGELSGTGLRAAWDENSFGIVSDARADIDNLFAIYEQFLKKNIVIMMAGNALPVFDNPGLVIGIADAMTEEILTKWYNHDKEHHQLRKDFDATGIEKLLKEKGKQYFALNPKRDWIAKDGSLLFWLNPMEQKENNYGWFKLEDLLEWAEGKGKIPVKKPQPASK
jgi:hypothetical protein